MLTEPQVFEETHLPRRLEHRDPEVQHLSRALEPTIRGEPAPDVLLSGPSGVGKTVLSRFVLRRVRERGAVPWTRIRCLGKTEGQVLREAIDALPIGAGAHRGMPVDELVRVLRGGLDGPAVLVLDEGDDLPETDLLDVLDRIANVSIVAICHNPAEWLARLGSLDSRFSGDDHLPLDRYGVSELTDILQARVDRGLRDGAVDQRVLESIADRAAGVARDGIQALRCAAEVAGEAHAETIREAHLGPGFERAREEIRRANLRSLPLHHHIVYEIVREFGPLSGRQLHEEYDRVAPRAYGQTRKTPIGKRYRRGVLSKLDDYDLIERETTKGSARYWAVDKELESELDVAAALVG